MYINDDCFSGVFEPKEEVKEEECCGETCEFKENKPNYDELDRRLEKANLEINHKNNLIEGLQNAIITNTCRIRDLESDIEYWRNRYYRENERANKYFDDLTKLKEGKN